MRDPAKNTPAVQEWLCKVEATLNRDLSRMEAELAVFGYTVIGPVREVAAP